MVMKKVVGSKEGDFQDRHILEGEREGTVEFVGEIEQSKSEKVREVNLYRSCPVLCLFEILLVLEDSGQCHVLLQILHALNSVCIYLDICNS